MAKRLVPNPITGKLDQVQDVTQIESDILLAQTAADNSVQSGDNISELVNDEAYQTATEVNTQVNNAIASLVDSSPAALDTLNELATALDDDPNFATTVNNSIAGKADLAHTHTHDDITDFDTEVQALIGSTNKSVRYDTSPSATINITDEIVFVQNAFLNLPTPVIGKELIIVSPTIPAISGFGLSNLNSINPFIESGSLNIMKIIGAPSNNGGSITTWMPITQSTIKDKYQVKFLSSDITANGTFITFNNLVIGKTYEINYNYFLTIDGASGAAGSTINHDGTVIAYAWVNLDTTGAARGDRSGITTVKFTATASTVSIDAVNLQAATDTILGNGTLAETHASITELNNIEEVSGF